MDELKTDPDFIQLLLFMMEERRNPSSVWKDYIAALPQDWSSFPLLYSEDELP